jgi:hypothetical protein
MALQSSGQISISNITSEKGEANSNVSLQFLSTDNINFSSPSKPNNSAPFQISEFYGYNHNYQPPNLEIEVHEILITEGYDYGDPDCFGFGEQILYKSGQPGIVQIGDRFFSSSPGIDNENSVNMWPLKFDYFNPDFGKMMFSFDDGNVVSNITPCGGGGFGDPR